MPLTYSAVVLVESAVPQQQSNRSVRVIQVLGTSTKAGADVNLRSRSDACPGGAWATWCLFSWEDWWGSEIPDIGNFMVNSDQARRGGIRIEAKPVKAGGSSSNRQRPSPALPTSPGYKILT